MNENNQQAGNASDRQPPGQSLSTGDAIWKIYKDLHPWPQLIAALMALSLLAGAFK
jgi:hypothetical protein